VARLFPSRRDHSECSGSIRFDRPHLLGQVLTSERIVRVGAAAALKAVFLEHGLADLREREADSRVKDDAAGAEKPRRLESLLDAKPLKRAIRHSDLAFEGLTIL